MTKKPRDHTPRTRRFIWLAGDDWRDFTEQLRSSLTTVVTWNGTSRLLDPASGWQQRIPLISGHFMECDHARQPLTHIQTATPCGVLTYTLGREYHCTTTVVAVLAGHHPQWASSTDGQATIAQAHSLPVTAPQHPAQRCNVAFCDSTNPPTGPHQGTWTEG